MIGVQQSECRPRDEYRGTVGQILIDDFGVEKVARVDGSEEPFLRNNGSIERPSRNTVRNEWKTDPALLERVRNRSRFFQYDPETQARGVCLRHGRPTTSDIPAEA